MKEFTERTAGTLTVSFKDVAGALAAPTSVTYQIDCVTTGQSVRASTAATAGATSVIAISSSDTAILNSGNQSEIKKVTVNATYGVGDEIHQEFHYSVRNLRYVP